MALPEKQNPPMATHEATTFLNNGGPVSQHFPRVRIHIAGDHGHRPEQQASGLLRGHDDTKIDADLLGQVDTKQWQPCDYGV